MLKLRSTGAALILVVSLALTGCLGDTTTSPDDSPDLTGPFLVLVSDRGGNPNLYRVDTDGTGLQQLTGPPGTDAHPDCSVDGREVAFESFGRRAGNDVTDIFILDRSPTIFQVTDRQGPGEDDSNPSWGPNGDEIALITSGRPEFDGAEDRLAIINDIATSIRGVGPDVRARGVDWSAGGHGLAVSLDDGGDGDLDLVRMDADGSGRQTVAADPERDELDPAWSGNSDRLAFALSEPGGGADIYSVRSDGSGLTRLTHDQARDVDPAWSPDGSEIAFASDRAGNRDVYVMDADGSNLRQVTDGASRDEMPTWCVR